MPLYSCPVTAHYAAALLAARGVHPLTVATPSTMTEALSNAFRELHIPLKEAPIDFSAIVQELKRLTPN